MADRDTDPAARLADADAKLRSVVDQHGCGEQFFALEICLEQHDRDFRRCQEALKRLQKCEVEKRKQQKAPQE